jgi:MoaA/NifB/PqqE/SkfB family radical SAM enzyme
MIDKKQLFYKWKGKLVQMHLDNSNLPNSEKFFNTPPKLPFRINWKITHNCNLSCKHCFIIHQKRCQSGLSVRDMKKLAYKITEAEPFVVSIGGGEPLIVSNILEILQILSSPKRSLTLATNGLLLDSRMLEKFSLLHNFAIQISLDGATLETHDYIRGLGSYVKIIDIIKNNRHLVPITVALTLTKLNCTEIYKVCMLCNDNGIDALKIQPFIKTASVPQSSLSPTKSDLQIAQKLLYEFIKANHNSQMQIFHPFEKSLILSQDNKYSLNIQCGARQLDECCITPKGDVFVCGASIDNDCCFGNVLEESMSSIWSNLTTSLKGRTNFNGACKCV